MYSLTLPLRKARNWWYHLCTGLSEYDRSDEEHYRQRILVMTSGFWLITVMLFALVVPLFMNVSPQGQVAANILFVASIIGVLGSMLFLRLRGDRLKALNVMLLIYCGSFATACFVFGGTQSPSTHC